MVQQKRKRSKKWIYWLILLALLVGAGVVCYLVWDNYFKVEESSQETEPTEIKEDKEPTVEETTGQEEVTDTTVNKRKVEQYDGDDPNVAETLSGAVTYAGINGDNLMIRVNIDQYLESGQCALTLKKGGATIYDSIANIVGGASTATCEGFDVPAGELGGGTIEINININSGERQGTIRGEVNI